MFNSYYNNLHNNPLFYFSNIYNSYISLLYMQSLQIEAYLISRSSPPFKLLVESNIEKKKIDSEPFAEKKNTEDHKSINKSTIDERPITSINNQNSKNNYSNSCTKGSLFNYLRDNYFIS